MSFIPKQKIVVAKTVSSSTVGYVAPKTLAGWASQAYNEFGWNTGIAVYQYSNDESASFLTTYVATANFNGLPGLFVLPKSMAGAFNSISGDVNSDDVNLKTIDNSGTSLVTSVVATLLILLITLM